MKINLNIKSIQYEDVAVKLVAALKSKATPEENAAGKIMRTVGNLPEDAVRSVAAAIPAEEMNEILALLVEEHQDKLLDGAVGLLQKQEIEAKIEKTALTKDLQVEITVNQIGYTGLATKFLPVIVNTKMAGDDSVGAVLAGLQKLPGFLVKKALDAMSQEKKDEIVVYLINRNKQAILDKLTLLAKENGVEIELEDLSAST